MSYSDKEELHKMIDSLKQKQAIDLILLQEQIQLTMEGVKPINILKNTLEEIVISPPANNKIMNGALVMGADFLLKKVMPKSTDGKLKKLIFSFLEFSVLKYVSK